MRPRAIPEGANWQGSAFDLYARSSEYARQMNGKTIPADLTTQIDDGQDFACGGRTLSSSFASRQSLSLSLTPPAGFSTSLDCTMLDVFTNERQIDAVVARTSHL